MHPVLLGKLSSYFVMWACAVTTGAPLAGVCARRAGFSFTRSVAAILALAATILLGSKLLYVAEIWAFPIHEYVPLYASGILHGFRIPGGFLLVALIGPPLVAGGFNLAWRPFGDAVVPAAALGLVFIRLGCLLNGCCFGTVASVPWAVRFPSDSWVYWYHRYRGWIPAGAPASLPVHPLQLYFVVAALATFFVLLMLQRRSLPPGRLQLIFYALFFTTSALLDPFRQNPLPLAHFLTVGAALLVDGWVVWSCAAKHHLSGLPQSSRPAWAAIPSRDQPDEQRD